MKTIALAGAAIAVLAALPAAAQTGAGRNAQPLTREALTAQVEAQFATLDADRDGFLTQAEVRAGIEAAHAARFARLGLRHFAEVDANADARLSLAEARTGALRLFDHVDTNRDGTVSAEERRAARAHLRGG
jgi:hypothetical protein